MKTKYLIFLTLGLLLLQACDDTTFQPKGDYISGWAVFVDTNIMTNGYYEIALYQYQNDPFSSQPVKAEVMNMNSTAPCYFRIQYGGSGNYCAAMIWVENTKDPCIPIILGTYGCDTTHNCTHIEPIEFPNFTGANYNILCWADTSKRVR